MVFSQGMLESNQGLYRLKKVPLVHFFLNQNWIAAWFPPITITSWLRWEYTPAKHPLPHTVYIYVWQLCGLPSSIFHFRKKKKTTFNQCFIKYVYVCCCCAIWVQTLHFSWWYRWELGQFKHRFIIPSANLNYFPKGFSCLYVSYLKFFNRNPTISWKVLQHGNQKL